MHYNVLSYTFNDKLKYNVLGIFYVLKLSLKFHQSIQR